MEHDKVSWRLAKGWPLAATVAGLAVSLAGIQPAEAGVFHPTGPMNNARQVHTATLLANGKVLVAGGYSTNNPLSGVETLSSAEVFDPATGTWTVTGAMSDRRSGHTATLLPSGKVLVAGGYSTNILSSAEVFDPTTGTWTPTGAMHTSRDGHTATLLTNGKVLVAGGDGTNSDPVVSAELYDPATGTWTETGALNEAHSWHKAILLGNGKVLIVAGYGLTGYAFLTELYDPATGTWSPTVDSFYALGGHRAALLPNGQVLATGGFQYGTFGNRVGGSWASVFDPTSAT